MHNLQALLRLKSIHGEMAKGTTNQLWTTKLTVISVAKKQILKKNPFSMTYSVRVYLPVKPKYLQINLWFSISDKPMYNEPCN